MLDNLSGNYTFKNEILDIEGYFKGRAHWSIGDRPANAGSECEDRIMPANAKKHPSYDNRKNAGLVPIRIDGSVYSKEYPLLCSEIDLK